MGKTKKILIVEDDQKISKALGMRLRGEGYDVVTASDGTQGVATARKESPDLVLLDISMPAGGGFFCAEGIRRIATLSSTALIFITASKSEAIKQQAMSFDPDGFIEKPFTGRTLLNAIEDVFGEQEKEGEIVFG
jgi:two-component system alkaline phosphatase synthesis response regulator PhoP